MSEKISGGCFCGNVRYYLEEEPFGSTICYCEDCRRAIGSQSVAWISVHTDKITFTKGNPKRIQSSPGVYREFCADCGTSLTYHCDKRTTEIDITTASLDHPNAFPATGLIFPSQKLHWDICPELPNLHDLK